jgi:hypothetical protein
VQDEKPAPSDWLDVVTIALFEKTFDPDAVGDYLSRAGEAILHSY